MIAELSFTPLSGNDNTDAATAEAVKVVKASGLEYSVTPMSVVVQGEWNQVMDTARKCHEQSLASNDRIAFNIRLDDGGNSASLADRVSAIENIAG